MTLRTFAAFEAEFSDDAELTQSGDIKRPSGYNIALVLCDTLRRQGLSVSEPKQHSFYGWTFSVSESDLRFWFLLQSGERWLLLSQNTSSLLRRLFRARSLAQHRSILEALNDSLRQDGRFRSIGWFTKEEFEKGKNRGGGARSP